VSKSTISAYLLIIKCLDKTTIKTRGGRVFELMPGTYIYVGSCGINCSRILRHLYSKKKRNFWHIDYLLDQCLLEKILIIPNISERDLASRIRQENYLEAVPKFGASDDPFNKSHLFRIKSLDNLSDVITLIIKKIFEKIS